MSKKNKDVKQVYVVYHDSLNHINKPIVCDPNTPMNWSLKELLLRGYELQILPDGRISHKTIKNMKGIIKLLQKLVNENKQARKDRFYTHVLGYQFHDIHSSLSMLREFVYNHLRQESKEAHHDPQEPPNEENKDEQCEPSPPGTCQPLD
jgi:hypothetical protein